MALGFRTDGVGQKQHLRAVELKWHYLSALLMCCGVASIRLLAGPPQIRVCGQGLLQ